MSRPQAWPSGGLVTLYVTSMSVSDRRLLLCTFAIFSSSVLGEVRSLRMTVSKLKLSDAPPPDRSARLSVSVSFTCPSEEPLPHAPVNELALLSVLRFNTLVQLLYWLVGFT